MMELAITLSDEQLTHIVDAVAEKIGARPGVIEEPMTVPDLARKLKVHESTLYRQIQAGSVKRIPSLNRVLIPAKEVNRLLGN